MNCETAINSQNYEDKKAQLTFSVHSSSDKGVSWAVRHLHKNVQHDCLQLRDLLPQVLAGKQSRTVRHQHRQLPGQRVREQEHHRLDADEEHLREQAGGRNILPHFDSGVRLLHGGMLPQPASRSY